MLFNNLPTDSSLVLVWYKRLRLLGQERGGPYPLSVLRSGNLHRGVSLAQTAEEVYRKYQTKVAKRVMFPMIVEKAVNQDLANKAAKTGSTVDVRDLMARYTTDFIGACGFDMESLEDENSVFQIENSVFHLLETVLNKGITNRPAGTTLLICWLLKKGEVSGCLFSFSAGFETSSSSSSYTLHQLAFHPEEQKKVQDEIDEVLLRYENKLCYDAIKEMKFRDGVLESMRLFPSVGFLIRNCTKKYTLPGSNVTIDEGFCYHTSAGAAHGRQVLRGARVHAGEFSPRDQDIMKCTYMPFGGERLGTCSRWRGWPRCCTKYSSGAGAFSEAPRLQPAARITQSIKGLPLRIKTRA
ncbi:Probable cytochrome P450 6a13 [Eumeta japonica]|uniref:unspecific monooxygenase n=1 Tax=Eumeta variegata TaxID=151549 RepID=A0A4C2A7J9_EUMVA|nr:Probable cytochrome P450 6a13 [Eumeta japonica]